MEDLTFGEQVKIILGRKGMTIKELAEIIEQRTGKKMSRQNLTQRLGRDNFQEQDMRSIAEILGCPFQLSILSSEVTVSSKSVEDQRMSAPTAQELEKLGQKRRQKVESLEEDKNDTEDSIKTDERDMTIGELYKIHEELSELEKNIQAGEPIDLIKKELKAKEETITGEKKEKFITGGLFLRKKADSGISVKSALAEESEDKDEQLAVDETAAEQEEFLPDIDDEFEPVIKHEDVEEDRAQGEINPYTGREYQSNSVRMHPSRIGYVQVYDRSTRKWTDMTEWAFLGYQERKKALLGKGYEPPIYLD
jgi:vacuolar-type H+-ATPase subunit I/STV1